MNTDKMTASEVALRQFEERMEQIRGIIHAADSSYHTWRLPIYGAPIADRLFDLKQTIGLAESLLSHPEMLRATLKPDGLNDGEFALGNWIVRPRFR